jgi:hypothetical protein
LEWTSVAVTTTYNIEAIIANMCLHTTALNIHVRKTIRCTCSSFYANCLFEEHLPFVVHSS